MTKHITEKLPLPALGCKCNDNKKETLIKIFIVHAFNRAYKHQENVGSRNDNEQGEE